jgi:hypothetical protein
MVLRKKQKAEFPIVLRHCCAELVSYKYTQQSHRDLLVPSELGNPLKTLDFSIGSATGSFDVRTYP